MKLNLFWILLVSFTILVAPAIAVEPDVANYLPPEGIVTTESLALAIANIVLNSIYGTEVMQAERPLRAKLVGNVWVVTGTLNRSNETLGGVASIRIRKSDGAILGVLHDK